MNSIISAADRAAVSLSIGAIHAVTAIKKGVMAVGEWGSLRMVDFYSIDGFEKLAKALASTLRFLDTIPAIKGIFTDVIETAAAQRDLYYSTLFIGTTAEMLRDRKARKDSIKVITALGNFFETGKFLQLNHVYSFAWCTELANKYGAWQIFNTRLDRLPVINKAFSTPRDVCNFITSSYEAWNCYKNPINKNHFDWANIFKFVGSTGKATLIFCSPYWRNNYLGFLDVMTQNASLFKLLLDRQRGRDKRFTTPGAA